MFNSHAFFCELFNLKFLRWHDERAGTSFSPNKRYATGRKMFSFFMKCV